MKNRQITFYNTLDEPNQELVRENVRMTPEERWEAYKKLYKVYAMLMEPPIQQPRSLSIERPSWM
jgi:hypothetical protein